MWSDEKQPDENITKPPDAPATTQKPQPSQTTQPNDGAPRPRRRGFAAMDRERVKQIASKGGRAAHAAGTAHQFSSDEARVAGKKGGMAPHVRRGGVRRRPTTEIQTPRPNGDRDGQSDGR
jgi:general stress protein YciG